MKKKACKQCRIFTEEAVCPICKKEQFTTTWQGRLYIVNAEKSQIAKAIGLEHKGEYAIKVR
ncbi:MAG: transcription elongation factor subunit Spt4 [Nanoarchaeota archaeon]